MSDQTAPQTYTFQEEIQQLLNILVHSLYTDRDIFLRELISNASDALNRVQFQMLTDADVLDPEAELAIRISADKDEHTLTISDTGIGMNRDELVHNLGTIAQSGAAEFLQRMQAQGATKAPATGPSTITGSIPTSVAIANAIADSVCSVSHQINANCTNMLPSSETACPLQIVKNLRPVIHWITLLQI